MIELLRDKDYAVIVTASEDIEGNSTIVDCQFPKMTLFNKKIPHLNIKYIINYGSVYINKIVNPDNHTKRYEIPSYARRLYINLDINSAIRQLGLSSKIMILQNQEGKVINEISNVIENADVDREAVLTSLFFDALENNFHKKFDKEAKKLKVQDGYLAMKNLFNGEQE